MRRAWMVAQVLAVWALCAPAARADDNDLVMSRLAEAVTDGTGAVTGVIGNNADFRGLASELGVVLAPRLLSPSDTLGFGGFQFAADIGYTSVNSDRFYWRAREGSPDPGNPETRQGEGIIKSFGMFVRKGLWLPVPSCEVGLGAVHLLDSTMWAAQGYVKLAVHEGYHDMPIPSVSVRGASSRMMGSEQVDLTIASFDLAASKDFGLQGTVTISPYLGWNHLWIVPRSEVLDKTPHIDPFLTPGDSSANFVFRDQDTISRNRLFVGFKLQYYVFQVTAEANFAFAGSSVDDRPGTDDDCATVNAGGLVTANCDAADPSGGQESYTLSLGLDF